MLRSLADGGSLGALTSVAPVAVLLPGLDGTASLFGPFVDAAPRASSLRPLPLPNDRPLSYRELSEWVLTQLPPGPIVLIAESFSGPLALLVADRCSRVKGVVLCASFVESPFPPILGHVPRFVWNRPPPRALVRFFLTGGDAPWGDAVRRAVRGVAPDVIAKRLEAVLHVDVGAELGRLTAPLLFLHAERDRVIPRHSHARARALKPSAQFAEVSAPHLLLQMAPAEAWTHIGPFLRAASHLG
jgi:pimeloyl-[acyl-carrier protein] methyl ester esterase